MNGSRAAVSRGARYQRRLTTRYGRVEDLKVPRPTEGGTEFTVLNRYERRCHHRVQHQSRPGPGVSK